MSQLYSVEKPKSGDQVEIFQDVLTQQDYEGSATLEEMVMADEYWKGYQVQVWEVRFRPDENPVWRRLLVRLPEQSS